MEKISEDLKETELKQATLREAYERLSSDALSIYLMHLKWKDLESHFNSTRSSLETQLSELVGRERSVETRETELGIKNSDFESKSKRLVDIESLIERRQKELERKDLEIDSSTRRLAETESSIRKKQRDLECQEKWAIDKARDCEHLKIKLANLERVSRQRTEELGLAQRSLSDLDKEISLRGEVLVTIQGSIGKCSSELESKQKQLEALRRELEMRKKMMVSLKKSADQFALEIEGRERILEDMARKVESLGPEFEEIVGSSRKEFEECLKEVESKEKRLLTLMGLLEERSAELEKRETRFRERSDEFFLIQKELENDPATKNTLFSEVKIEQSEISNGVANVPSFASYQYCTTNGHFLRLLLTEQLMRHSARCNELFSALLCSRDPARLALEAVRGFYPRSRDSDKVSVFELTNVRSSCILLLERLAALSPEISREVREEAKILAGDWKAKMAAAEGTVNQLEVVGFWHLRECYKLQSEFSNDDIRSFARVAQTIRQESPFELPSCFQIEKPVENNEAEALTENVPSRPNLVCQDLTQDDILAALQMPDPAKHALGMVKRSFSLGWERELEESFVKGFICILEQILRNSLEIRIEVREEATKLAREWRERVGENCLEALGILLFVAAYGLVSEFNEGDIARLLEIVSRDKRALKQSVGDLSSAYKIDVYIRNLIGKKKLLVAARLSCAFDLTMKFSPVKLLTGFIDEAKNCSFQLCNNMKCVEEKDKATDIEIEALREVAKFVKDHNLESKFPPENVTKRIALLEKIKMDRKHSAEFFQGVDEQGQQSILCSNNKRKKITNFIDEQEKLQGKLKKRPKKKSTITAVKTPN